MIECFRRLSLSAALVFVSPGSAAQGIFAVIISMLSLWLYASYKQFPTRSANRLGAMAQMTLFLTMLAALMIQMDVSEVSAWLVTPPLLIPYYGRAVVGSMAPRDGRCLPSTFLCASLLLNHTFNQNPPSKANVTEYDDHFFDLILVSTLLICPAIIVLDSVVHVLLYVYSKWAFKANTGNNNNSGATKNNVENNAVAPGSAPPLRAASVLV